MSEVRTLGCLEVEYQSRRSASRLKLTGVVQKTRDVDSAACKSLRSACARRTADSDVYQGVVSEVP